MPPPKSGKKLTPAEIDALAEEADMLETREGGCHCGRVRITLPRKPDEVTHCNCSLCSKTGFQGIYFPSAELEIEGDTDRYVRADSNPAYIAQHRCRHCGIITHWTPLTDPPTARFQKIRLAPMNSIQKWILPSVSSSIMPVSFGHQK